ncbi:hypothetical protein IPO96_03670 [Candidatus Saccharibacteria bacterium]|jgi:hypothetical protein|nr:MAG: hypothetical protein IPO96_03670 [Candidatus Saccharibacteria bacterium]
MSRECPVVGPNVYETQAVAKVISKFVGKAWIVGAPTHVLEDVALEVFEGDLDAAYQERQARYIAAP